jgi:hypothetical protein
MSAKPQPKTTEAQQARASVIAGQSLTVMQPSTTHVIIRERHGVRCLLVSAISQLAYHVGILDGPWLVRCDGQQIMLGKDRETAHRIAQAMGIKLEELEP